MTQHPRHKSDVTNDRGVQVMEDQIPHLQRYARTLESTPDRAEDLVQDCLERGISRIHRFERGTDLRSWLFTIMRNLFIDGVRKQQRRGPHVPVEDWLTETQQPPDQIDRMRVRDAGEAFGNLRPRDQRILRLVVIEGKRYQDVADELDIAVGTVKSGLSRARQTLAEAA